MTPATPAGMGMTASSPSGAVAEACEFCGAPPSRTVPLVESDMSARRHRLCERCWTRLVDGLPRQRPWLHLNDDPERLYVTVVFARSLIGNPGND